MTSLAAVATYVPSASESVSPILRAYGMNEREIRAYHYFYGFREIRRDRNVGMAAQLIAAGRALTALAGQEHRVRYVMQSRTMPVAVPYPLNPLHEARDALGLTHALAFSVNQHACASTLLAVELAGRMLAEDGDPTALALVFGGEKTFTKDADVLGVTAVMGEGVAAILVRSGDGADRMLSYATRTYGQFHRSTRMSDEHAREWADLYAQALTEVIVVALQRAGTTIDDVTLILPHHVNKISWLKVLRMLGIVDSGRLYLGNLSRLGHCFGADSFFNYRSAVSEGLLADGDRYVMTSVGLGATFSAMVFEH